MTITKRNGTAIYTTIQVLYWSTYGIIFSFASKFLQNREFTATEIGLCMGICYMLSALLQPVLADFFTKRKIRLNMGMIGIYMVILALAVLNLFTRPGKIGTAVIFVCMASLQSVLQPSVNSLHRGYVLNGIPVSFSFARGCGSLAFSILVYLVGMLLTKMSPDLLPIVYITTIVLLMIALYFFPSPVSAESKEEQKTGTIRLLKSYPKFALFLVGVVCLAFAHIFIDGFMLQICQSLGGDTAEQGTGAAIAALTELPAMVIYAKCAKKVGCRPLVLVAGWGWMIKNLMVCLASSFVSVYIAMLLQFFAYAVYVPCAVDFVSAALPEEFFLKGQALNGTAFTLGSLLATMIGGRLMDMVGVHTSLIVMSGITLVGAIFFTLAATPFSKQNR